MRTYKPAVGLTLSAAVVAVLAGCATAEPATVTEAPTNAALEPVPSVTPNPPEPDSMLWIRATASAPNGAQLSLEAMVHRSTSYEYPGTQTMNQIMIDDCGASLTNAILAADKWSLTRMNTTAIAPVGSSQEWPNDLRIGFRPSADVVYMSARGMIQSDDQTGDLQCTQDKYFAGAGKGAFVVGIPGDTVDLDHFNNGWAGHTWGFTAPAGVTLSDCSFEITPLAVEYGGDSGWVQVADPANCYVGPTEEASVF